MNNSTRKNFFERKYEYMINTPSGTADKTFEVVRRKMIETMIIEQLDKMKLEAEKKERNEYYKVTNFGV